MQTRTRRSFGRLALLATGNLLLACTAGGGQGTSPASTVRPPAAGPAPAGTAAGQPSTSAAQPSSAPATPVASNAENLAPVGLAVGKRAPAWSLTTVEGKPVSSAEFLAQKKPYVLFFWATW
ncbi:MAG: redoxin domain-containing protein [Chloroflexi bacterium]|nr:redoxin domain-containing protein [Chloroflexota bacterium]